MDGETPEQGPEPGGPVHYQISITGRQAAVFFLMLLAAVGLSFFLGMKTGAAAKKGTDAVTTIAGASDLPVSLPPDESVAKEPASAAATPTLEVAEKKLGFEDAGPAATEKAEKVAEKAPEKVAEKPVDKPAEKPVETTPAAKPSEKPAEKSAEKHAEKAAEKPAVKHAEKPAAKGWHVQVFATKDGKKADDLVKKLKAEGFKADVSPSPKNAELFVVRVGPQADKAKAEAQRKKILKANPSLKGMMVVPS